MLPGVAIIGAEAGGGYGAVSGTSVAAAQAAGLVAILAAQHTDWSAARLRLGADLDGRARARARRAARPRAGPGRRPPDTATASLVTVGTRPARSRSGSPATTGGRAAS